MRYFVISLLIGGALLAAPISMVHYGFDPAQGEPNLPASLKGTALENDYYIIQFTGSVQESYKQGVIEYGAEFYYYIPENAFVVKLNRSSLDAVKGLPQVAWVGYYHPAYRLSPTIGKHVFKTSLRKNDTKLRLFITPFAHVDLQRLFSDIEGAGAQIIEGTSRIIEVRIDRSGLENLARVNGIFWIEEKPECFLANSVTRWVIQTNVTNDTTVWAHGIHGEGEIMGCMDSGIDILHCFHRDPEGDPPGANHRKVKAYREYTTPVGFYDYCEPGHGTHVIGTVQGDDYTNTIPSYNGMAYKAVVTFGDVQDTSWEACGLGAVYPPGDLTTDFTAAYNDGARAHTNSWGSTTNDYDAMAQQVDQSMWDHKDLLILFANGNAGPNANTVGSPATAKSCVSVGATQQAPSQNAIADFSSRGTAYDGRIKPTVCAPGVGINSADNSTSQSCAYVAFDGTSMATPATAGATMLVRQYYRLGFYPGGSSGSGPALLASAALMKSTLINSADKMGSLTYPGIEQGYGRIDLNNALYFAGESRRLLIEDNTAGLNNGATWSKEFQVPSGGQPLKVVLCWSDYPGAQSANPAIVNNLDLEVEAPGGSVYRGNNFTSGWSQPGGSADALNVEEVVWIQTPATGTWTVRVIGDNVPQAPQPFAVTITGEDVTFTGIVENASQELSLPSALDIIPSVGSGSFRITYSTYHKGQANIEIYDAAGRLILAQRNTDVKAGNYETRFDGREFSNGVYFVYLKTDERLEVKKFLIVK